MLVTIDTQQLHPDGDVMPLCGAVNKNRERVQGPISALPTVAAQDPAHTGRDSRQSPQILHHHTPPPRLSSCHCCSGSLPAPAKKRHSFQESDSAAGCISFIRRQSKGQTCQFTQCVSFSRRFAPWRDSDFFLPEQDRILAGSVLKRRNKCNKKVL